MEHQEIERQLLTPLWRGLSADYKRKYARNIWQQFEDNLRVAAAHTSNLRKLVNSICSKLAISLRGADIAAVNELLNSGADRAILKVLREETTYLVMLVRLENERRKEESAEKYGEWKINMGLEEEQE